jgi:LemA protein
VLGVVAALALFAIVLYNRLIGFRNQTLNGWRQIDVQLKRRHDLIPNLVNTVRGAMEFERDTLTQVMEARARAVSATGPADAARKKVSCPRRLVGCSRSRKTIRRFARTTT